jgi:peptidoglycan/LPS O-acetylase OafA/YrhL
MGLLRFFLALGVVAGHTSSLFGFSADPVFPGSRAVQIFYMISGFLIALILDGKYANSLRGTWIFYTNRAMKIFVPYLIVLLATVMLSLSFYAVTGNALTLGGIIVEARNMVPLTWVYIALTNLCLFGLEWAYVLVYRGGQLFFDLHAMSSGAAATQFVIDLPAWTLSIELTFYLVAPFILRRHFLLIAALACGSQCFRYLGYHFRWYSEATDYRFFPFEVGLFLYGALIYRARDLLDVGDTWRAPLSAGLICFLFFLPRYFLEHQYQTYAAVGVLLPSLFKFTGRHRWDRWLGELSYPLYILHFPLLWFTSAVLARWLPSALGRQTIWPLLATATAIGLAAAMHHLIVAPLDRWRQSRVGRDATLSGHYGRPRRLPLPRGPLPLSHQN